MDTSAAIKLVRSEAYSNDLSRFVAERRESQVLSSVLIEVELPRATRRIAPESLDRAAEVLRGIGVLTLSPSVMARAAGYAEPHLQSSTQIIWRRPSTWCRSRGKRWKRSSPTTSVFCMQPVMLGSVR